MVRSVWNYRVSFLILFCLAAFCGLNGAAAYMRLEKLPPVTTFQSIGGLTAADYEPMLRAEAQAEEPLNFALWSQTDGSRVEGPSTGRTEDVAWIVVKGDTRLLLPFMETLDDEDTHGCLIDAATSEALFKNSKAEGSTVKVGDTEYTVRGVIGGPGRTFVTRSGSGQLLSNITVSGTRDTDAFLMRHSLAAAVTVKSSLYTEIARTLSLLPVFAAIFSALLLLALLKSYWRDYHARCLCTSATMLAVGTAGLLLLFTVIPEALIPSRWSDFEFWETAGRDFTQAVADFISAPKYRSDLVRLYEVLKAAFGIPGAHFVLCIYNLFRIHYGRPAVLLSYRGVPEQPQLGGGEENAALLQEARE